MRPWNGLTEVRRLAEIDDMVGGAGPMVGSPGMVGWVRMSMSMRECWVVMGGGE